MMARYRLVMTPAAEEDLERLFDFVAQRELSSANGDLTLPPRAIDAIMDGLKLLEHSPYTCRKVGDSSFVRELIIPFGHTGYVALFEIVDAATVSAAAVRHQREDDYH